MAAAAAAAAAVAAGDASAVWRWAHVDGGSAVAVFRVPMQDGEAEEQPTSVLVMRDGQPKVVDGMVPVDGAAVQAIFGCIGLVRAHRGSYAIAVTDAEPIRLAGRTIWRVRACASLLCGGAVDPTDAGRIAAFIAHLSSGHIYLSHQVDLTRRLERQHPSDAAPDDRFIWNHHLLFALTGDAAAFGVPVIYGYVGVASVRVFISKRIEVAVISRRARHRPGLRYTRRGVDADGHVANFVETEQLVVHGAHLSSFVQTRGSVPLFWNQTVDLSYKPRLRIRAASASAAATARHFDAHMAEYGSVAIANLLSPRGFERPLCEAYRQAAASLGSDRLPYFEFSVNDECKGMRYDRISVLIARLSPFLRAHGTTALHGSAYVRRQSGAVRTNCLDCLDRTNLTQLMIALDALPAQLADVGLLDDARDGSALAGEGKLHAAVRALWADSGDDIGRQYAGTAALKAAYARTGRPDRLRGGLQDGANALLRYYYNNFVDGGQQDVLDALHGHLPPSEAVASPRLAAWWSIAALVGLAIALIGPARIASRAHVVLAIAIVAVALTAWRIARLDGALIARQPRLPDRCAR